MSGERQPLFAPDELPRVDVRRAARGEPLAGRSVEAVVLGASRR